MLFLVALIRVLRAGDWCYPDLVATAPKRSEVCQLVSAKEEKFRKFRTAEIKHGRPSAIKSGVQVAWGEGEVKLPFLKDVPSGVTALQTTKGLLAAGVLFAACGYMETKVWKQDETKEPGNFGDPAGWSQTGLGAGTYSKTMRERELNNGRFAMFASVGIIAAELVSGKDWLVAPDVVAFGGIPDPIVASSCVVVGRSACRMPLSS
ncbi:FCPF [Symbiodinium necroappetens]|uniref:FCPF protein n=1 Tax=Symbiodinium necroappetens TaxID=1628268 RepID=A0A813C5E3_9DINO|nr:FCPF [Symbiodinium necroappetens]